MSQSRVRANMKLVSHLRATHSQCEHQTLSAIQSACKYQNIWESIWASQGGGSVPRTRRDPYNQGAPIPACDPLAARAPYALSDPRSSASTRQIVRPIPTESTTRHVGTISSREYQRRRVEAFAFAWPLLSVGPTPREHRRHSASHVQRKHQDSRANHPRCGYQTRCASQI